MMDPGFSMFTKQEVDAKSRQVVNEAAMEASARRIVIDLIMDFESVSDKTKLAWIAAIARQH